MSRQASIAVGGYYPLPIHLVPRIASLIGIPVAGRYAFMDPCAGEGDAIRVLIDRMFPRPFMHITRGLAPPDVGPTAYLIEMEETRRRELHAKFHGAWYGPINVYEGDAFRARWTPSSKRPGVSCLYLNPPYDTHLRYKRMEEKFLRRFTGALAPGGVLVFVVPYHALKASAETLARHYQNVFCYRFPDPDWDTFKQVVLFANRLPTELMDPDPTTQGRVEFWALNPDEIPVLEERPGRVAVSLPLPLGQSQGNRFQEFMHGLEDMAILPMDTMAVLEHYLPWGATDRRGRTALTPGVFVDPLSDDLTVRIYPTLMPPRPAHIAAGIASGVFNGERVVPDDPTSTAPALLVKGVFDREFETVEEKKDRDGMVTGEVQVQQPRLVVTVLDLSTSKVHVLKSSVDITGSVDPATMTTGDLLVLYSRSLLQVLKDHCPVTYDPADPSQAFDLASLARPLYTAQAHAVRAMVLDLGGRDVPLRRRTGRDTVLLGEIGSGKSSMAFSTALSCGATKILVMCPPHLLDSWRDEIRLLRPDATVMVLADVQGVEEFDRMDPSHITVALLSRETAKLGHGYVGVGPTCPRCGTHLTTDAETQARTRLRCEHTYRRAANAAADLLERSCVLALPYFPKNPVIVRLAAQRLSSRTMARAVPAYKAHRQKDGTDIPLSPEEVEHLRSRPWVRALWRQVLVLMGESITGWLQEDNALWRVLRSLVAFYHDDVLTAEIAEMCFVGATLGGSHLFYGMHPFHTIALTLVRYITPGSALQEQILARFTDWTQVVKGVTRDDIYATRRSITLLKGTYTGMGHINLTSADGVLSYQSFALGSPSHLSSALEVLYQAGTWYHAGAKCGEPLYQAVPDPRRFPLATFISRYYPNLFDFLILDEAHELGTDGSAQERAAHRLSGLRKPTILMTGSLMNGYARSLFANWWALFPKFREAFGREDQRRFVDRFGYRKRLVQDVDQDTGKVQEFGSRTDRVDRKEKDLGDAPGLLPLFILEYLLPHAATIQKADLALELPPCRDIPIRVKATQEQMGRHMGMLRDLLDQVKADAFTDLMGKLWGQVAESPSQLDRATADVGGGEGGSYEVRYPESVGAGLVHRVEPFSADNVMPKEQWVMDLLASTEFPEGRNVIVFTWHTELLPRMQRLLQARFGFKAPILDPAKVPTGKRQAWITTNVVNKRARVLLANPVCVQTGLNNLVYFSSEVWMENPACNPYIFRQARGRVDRIGQKAPETRIYFPLYDSVGPNKLHSLLLHKVGVSMATDGLDAESALQAAGVGETGAGSSFSVGKELYRIMQEMWGS